MSLNIKFSQDKRVALYTWNDPITLVDFEYGFNTIGAAYEQAYEPIHSIFVSKKSLPLNSIGAFINHPNSQFLDPKAGVLIVVGPGSSAKAIMDMTTPLLPGTKVLSCDSLEEAYDMMQGILQQELEQV
jgi:hypothetical protein